MLSTLNMLKLLNQTIKRDAFNLTEKKNNVAIFDDIKYIALDLAH